MSAHKIYPVRDNISNTALINKDSYLEMYEASISEPDKFWAEQAEKFLTWDASWSEICSGELSTGDAKWFLDGKLNVSTNCIDRHLTDNREKIAIWEGDSPEDSKHISYEELLPEVCKLGNLLRASVKKGRSSLHIHANGPRGGICDVGLYADWSNSLSCFWWILARSFKRSNIR